MTSKTRNLVKTKFCLGAVLPVAALFIAGAMPAGAALMTLTVSDGTQTDSFTDSGTGLISESGLVLDNWTFGQLTAIGPGVIGELNSDLILDLNWGAISTRNNTAPLTMTVTESGVNGAPYQASDVNLSIGGIQIASQPGTVTHSALINGSTVLSQGPFITNPYGGTASAAAAGGSSFFSFSDQVVIKNLPGAMTYIGGDASAEDLAVVPEPSYATGSSVVAVLFVAGMMVRKQRVASNRI